MGNRANNEITMLKQHIIYNNMTPTPKMGMEESIIICGFAGIGKSTIAKESTFVDLESTPFKKNWDLYADVAIHMYNNGYTPMVSCHKEIREKLRERGAKYIVVIPNADSRSVYLENYKKRGNSEAFVQMFTDKFDSFLKDIRDTEVNVIELQKCQYIKDLYPSELSLRTKEIVEMVRVFDIKHGLHGEPVSNPLMRLDDVKKEIASLIESKYK